MIAIGSLEVAREAVSHPLLGRAHVIYCGGQPITAVSEMDWQRPTRIPAIAAPGALPPGEGARLLNAIAERAANAGVRALRYAGPYPTPALFRALTRSFRTSGTEAAFTADLLGRAARLASDEIPIDFKPAPHVRVDFAGGWSELRPTLERTVIDGTPYEPGGSPGRLVGDRAEVWFGDRCYACVAQMRAEGTLRAGPHPLPALDSPVIGQAFPAELRAVLADLIADAVPTPLAAAARHAICHRDITWADLGARAAQATTTGFAVHAALWHHVAPMARLGLALAESLSPVVTRAIIASL